MKKTVFFAAAAALIPFGSVAGSPNLTVYDYSSYESPRLHRSYIETNGQGPHFVFFDNSERAFDAVADGLRIDVIQICSSTLPKWTDAGLLGKWDDDRRPEQILPDMISDSVQNMDQYHEYFVPFEFGANILIYDSTEVPAADLADLGVFKNSNYAGRISLPADFEDLAGLAFLATGTTDWSSPSASEVEGAIAWLREVHPNVHSYWTDEADLEKDLVSGSVLVAWAWNTVYSTMTSYLSKIKAAAPSEGTALWLCGYALMDASKVDLKLAYDFLEARISESTGRELFGWGAGLADEAILTKLSSKEKLEAEGLFANGHKVFFQGPMETELRQYLVDEFEAIMQSTSPSMLKSGTNALD